MNLSLIYGVPIVCTLVALGMFKRQWLLTVWALAILVFPTMFLKIGQAPVYLYDVVPIILVAAFCLSGEWNRWPRGMPKWHFWLIGAALILSVGCGTARYGLLPEIFWIWGHTSLAWLSFGIAVIVATGSQRENYRASLRWGVLLSAIVLCVISVIQYADLPGHEMFASFFYRDHAGRTDMTEILRRGVETNRANGPHSAPPALAGIALLTIIAFWLASDVRHRWQRWLVLAAAATTILCTVSRHAILAAVLGLVVIILLSDRRTRAKLITAHAALVLLVGLAVAGGLLRHSWTYRLSKTSEGVLADDNIAARVLWGPARLASFISREPSILLTGAGLDPEKLESRAKLGSHFETGFVSNGFLLPLYYLGIFGFCAFALFWVWAFIVASGSTSAQRSVRAGFVVMAALLVASDNYGFVYEPAICFLFLVVGLIAGDRHHETVAETAQIHESIPEPMAAGEREAKEAYAG